MSSPLVVIEKIRQLQQYDEYIAAFIFGSYVRDEFGPDSDLDFKVITKEDRPFTILNPVIEGIKLDLTFISYQQLKRSTEKEMEKGDRPPIIYESKILFDKEGETTTLRDYVRENAKPRIFDKRLEYDVRFSIYHLNNKITRYLNSDKDSTLLSMHVAINELIKALYASNEKWYVSDKRLIKDLGEWNKEFLELLGEFINESDPQIKYNYWNQLYNNVLNKIGGYKPLSDFQFEFKNDLTKLL
ncbi:MAG: nucleotidyltransferase domain-containing protein [Candidatus Dojkabacteria bacterium]